MFRYQHPVRSFGTRRTAVALAQGDDLRFFIAAYLAGAAFTLAYIF